MDQNKEATFKCPSCGEMLSVESKDNSGSSMDSMKSKPKMNTGNMPMGQLRSKIAPTTNPPGMTSPNMNSY
jgi:transcription initiation factor IIE alpha subunit